VCVCVCVCVCVINARKCAREMSTGYDQNFHKGLRVFRPHQSRIVSVMSVIEKLSLYSMLALVSSVCKGGRWGVTYCARLTPALRGISQLPTPAGNPPTNQPASSQ
jgi:hypothetical protein